MALRERQDTVRRIKRSALVGFVILLIIIVAEAYKTGGINLHRQIDGMPVSKLRMCMWDYYADHNHPPARLSEICPQAGRSNVLRIGTMQHILCVVEYYPRSTRPGGPAAFVRCGDPVIRDCLIDDRGQIIQERWYPHGRWRALVQRRVDLPDIEFRRFNAQRIPPPDFDKVVGPWIK